MTIELGKGTPPAAAISKVDELTERKMQALWRLHLRHAGMVRKRIASLVKPNQNRTFSAKELTDIANEWRRLYPGGENP